MNIEDFNSLRPFRSRNQFLDSLADSAIDGLFLEFGVFKGDSIRQLSHSRPYRKVFGFDSFKGLPEDWKRSDNSTYKKGHFDLKGGLPAVPNNVTLIPGFFENTLPHWLELNRDEKIALVHIDSDLYSSAKYALSLLNKKLEPGTIIIFDELSDFGKGSYPAWEDGEWKALNEWLTEFRREVVPIARTEHYQAAVRIMV